MPMNVGKTLKNVGFALTFLLLLAAVFVLPVIFIVGVTAVSFWVREWIPVVFWINLLIASSFLGLYHLFRLHDLSLPMAF